LTLLVVCPNPQSEKYGKVSGGNIILYGKTREGRQRFQCRCCRKTFNERKGTLFYNRKAAEHAEAVPLNQRIAPAAAYFRSSTSPSAGTNAKNTLFDVEQDVARHATFQSAEIERRAERG